MTKRKPDDRRAEWDEGLARLEQLTKQFQQELGALRQVASDSGDDELTALEGHEDVG